MSGPAGALDEAAVLAALAEVAREHLDWHGTLRPETPLVEALELDSLRLLTLVVEVENRFRICLDEGEERAVATAGELAALVRHKLAETNGG